MGTIDLGAGWVNDPKLLGAAVGLLLYLAYFVLRGSIDDMDRRARVASVTNIMFYAIFVPAIFIVPRLTDSLHPGNGGNPAFSSYDLDNNMRMVFYPGSNWMDVIGRMDNDPGGENKINRTPSEWRKRNFPIKNKARIRATQTQA